jgi:hypothetical protein
MHYLGRLALALLTVPAAVLAGGCTDALSSPRTSPVPASIRTPQLSQFRRALEPSLDLSSDCDLGISNDPACNGPCDSAYGCGDSGAPPSGPSESSGGDLSSTHVVNPKSVVRFSGTNIEATASADFQGNYFKQTATARSYRNGAQLSTQSRIDESNETYTFGGFLHVKTDVTLPTGVNCGLTAGASGVHRAETRVPWTGITLGFKQVGSDAPAVHQSSCSSSDGSGAGGGDTVMITCIYKLRYENGVLVSETLVTCL